MRSGRAIFADLDKYRERLAQRYVSDLLLTPDGRKFDLRLYWVVASFKPELVLYFGGTQRVSASNFSAANNAGTRAENQPFAVGLGLAFVPRRNASYKSRRRRGVGALRLCRDW